MRFAVIGSGTIVEKMIAAGKLVKGFELYAVCSRTQERAQAFAQAKELYEASPRGEGC